MFELFRLNPGRDLSLHYIIGSEKVARVVADLSDLVTRYAFKFAASARNEFAVAVVNRGAPDGPTRTNNSFLKVLMADSEEELPISSTAIRQTQSRWACPRRVEEFMIRARLYGTQNSETIGPSGRSHD